MFLSVLCVGCYNMVMGVQGGLRVAFLLCLLLFWYFAEGAACLMRSDVFPSLLVVLELPFLFTN